MIERELLEDKISGIKLNNGGPIIAPILCVQMTSYSLRPCKVFMNDSTCKLTINIIEFVTLTLLNSSNLI